MKIGYKNDRRLKYTPLYAKRVEYILEWNLEMMFQGPKGYIAQIYEVHLQYGNSTPKWPFYTFF